jgi:dedicator of cytokinesis protein 3
MDHETLSNLVTDLNKLIRLDSPTSIVGTQALAIQCFPNLTRALSVLEQDTIADMSISFINSIRKSSPIPKLILLNALAPTWCSTSVGRSTFIPEIVRWTKASLGNFDDLRLDGGATKENWTVQLRLTFTLLAIVLDSCSNALCDPTIIEHRQLLEAEQDNLEYILNLLRPLLESHNLLPLEQLSSTAVNTFAFTFPQSYPFPFQTADSGGRQDAAAIILSLLLIAPHEAIVNSFEGTLEIEGTARFTKLALEIITTFDSMLNTRPNWINFELVGHRVILKALGPILDIIQRDDYKFNESLWQALLSLSIKLLSSPRLTLELFPKQKG